VPETLSHFTSVCGAFHHARTAAHNQVWQVVTQELRRAMPPGWQVFVETAMRDTGLLRTDVLGATRAVLDAQLTHEIAQLGNLRPDAVAVNRQLRKIAILDLTRPFDGDDRAPVDSRSASRPLPDDEARRDGPEVAVEVAGSNSDTRDQVFALGGTAAHQGRRSIQVAAARKMEAYGPLMAALRNLYGGQDWTVEVLPWVVGVRGILDATGIQRAFAFLDIPVQRRQGLLRTTAVASVQSFAFLHRVRQSANPRRILMDGLEQVVPRKRKRGEEAACTWQRWQRLRTDSMRTTLGQARWRGVA